MTSEGTPVPDTSAARSISDRVNLEDLRTGRISADLRNLPERGPLTIQPATELDWDLDEGVLTYHLHFDLEVTEPGESDSDAPVLLYEASVRVDVSYSFESDAGDSEEGFRAFGELSVLHTAYPYVRELVHTLTVRAGLPPLVLPSFRAVAPTQAGDDE